MIYLHPYFSGNGRIFNMSFIELLLIAIGLSMDAFAVSVSQALTAPNFKKTDSLKFGVFFGGFQALMPLIGWLFGRLFSAYVTAIDHWVAFVLLGYIGIKMILDATVLKDEDSAKELDLKLLLVLAFATSIDALAVGVSFAFMKVNILSSILTIGITTFILSPIGALLGKKIGSALGNKAQILGGVILVIMGVNILLQHLLA